jgi:O-antigen ligase
MSAAANPIYDLTVRIPSLTEYLRPHFLGLTLFFCLCLVPIVVDGASSNYLFLLYPLPALLYAGKLRRPHENMLFAITVYSLVLVTAMLYQYEYMGLLDRRLISFTIFMSVFTFVFVPLSDEAKSAFKLSVVVMGCYFTFSAIWTFFTMGGAGLGAGAKDLVGSQRYGFIYLLSFWLLYQSNPENPWLKRLRIPLMFMQLVGLGLTFSRASIVALVFSYGLFFLWSLRIGQENSLSRVLKSLFFILLGAAVAATLVSMYFPVLWQFFDERLIQLFLSSDKLENNLSNSATSEGERIFIWTTIANFVLSNPITGSGFIGSWILGPFGSAHNQYMDVLVRTGFIGFAIYLALLVKITLFAWRHERPIFWALLGIFIYGMFHETFKESQGGFALAFILGMASQQSGERGLAFFGPAIARLRASAPRRQHAFGKDATA